ncbi:hypothetical protein GCM10009739_23480 [Microbacterium ulmi]
MRTEGMRTEGMRTEGMRTEGMRTERQRTATARDHGAPSARRNSRRSHAIGRIIPSAPCRRAAGPCRGIRPSVQYQFVACEWPHAPHGVPYAREM